jgi:hypothetical protein
MKSWNALIASAVAVAMLSSGARQCRPTRRTTSAPLLIDSLLSEHGIASGEVSFNNNVAFPGVATALKTDAVSVRDQS